MPCAEAEKFRRHVRPTQRLRIAEVLGCPGSARRSRAGLFRLHQRPLCTSIQVAGYRAGRSAAAGLCAILERRGESCSESQCGGARATETLPPRLSRFGDHRRSAAITRSRSARTESTRRNHQCPRCVPTDQGQARAALPAGGGSRTIRAPAAGRRRLRGSIFALSLERTSPRGGRKARLSAQLAR